MICTLALTFLAIWSWEWICRTMGRYRSMYHGFCKQWLHTTISQERMTSDGRYAAINITITRRNWSSTLKKKRQYLKSMKNLMRLVCIMNSRIWNIYCLRLEVCVTVWGWCLISREEICLQIWPWKWLQCSEIVVMMNWRWRRRKNRSVNASRGNLRRLVQGSL